MGTAGRLLRRMFTEIRMGVLPHFEPTPKGLRQQPGVSRRDSEGATPGLG